MRSDAGALFDYIDLSAVDQERKMITEARRVSCAEAPSRARQLIQRGDVLVSTVRPNLNGVARVTESFDGTTASTGFCVLRPHKSELDGSYLFHWVKSPIFVADMVKKATGASYPAVSDRIIFDSEISLPPLPEQRRIAEVLDKGEALRAKRRAALAELDSLTQSLFLDLFGDPVANPKGWPLHSFDETMRDETSKSQRLNQTDFLETGRFPVIDQGQSKIAGYCDQESMLCISKLPVVVFGDHTKAVKLVSHPFVVGADGAKVLVPKSGIEAVFLAYLLRNLPIPALGYSRHMREVKRLQFVQPPLDLQREFIRQVSAVEKLQSAQRASLAELDTLFSSLQQRAFSGQLFA